MNTKYSDKTTDHELLRAFTDDGSDAAFRELSIRYSRLVKSVAYRILGNAERAEDVCQSVFTKLSEKAPDLDMSKGAAPWLYQVARQTALDLSKSDVRYRNRNESYAQQFSNTIESSPRDEVEQCELRLVVEAGVTALPESYRAVFMHAYFEDMPVTLIARQLGVSKSTVSMRLIRGRSQLRKILIGLGVSSGVIADVYAGAVSLNLGAGAAPVALNAASSTGMFKSFSTLWQQCVLHPMHSLCTVVGALVIGGFCFSAFFGLDAMDEPQVELAAIDAISLPEVASNPLPVKTQTQLSKKALEILLSSQVNFSSSQFMDMVRILTYEIEQNGIESLVDDAGEHYLSIASRVRGEDAVLFLLLHGADPNVVDSYGRTPLHYIAMETGHRDASLIRDMLVLTGADLNVLDHERMSPLMYAAQNDAVQHLEFLVWAGAELHPENVTTIWHPIAIARTEGHARTLEILEAYEATPYYTLQQNPAEIPQHIERSFVEAARMGDFEQLDNLLEAGQPLDAYGKNGRTPLLSAVDGLQPDVVTYLLLLGANEDLGIKNGYTPLMGCMQWICFESNWMQRMLILAGADINGAMKNKHNHLTWAIRKGNEHGLQWLILGGADPRLEGELGTPMHIASKLGQSREMKILHEWGVKEDPYWSDDPQWQMFTAVKAENLGKMERVMKNHPDFDLNFRDEKGDAIMTIAIHSRRMDAARKLLELGADPNYTCKSGDTALIATCAWNYTDIHVFRRELIEAGAEVNAANKNGFTALMRASMYGFYVPNGGIDTLIEHGADLYQKDKKGRTALDFAIKSGRSEAADRLRKAMGIVEPVGR